MAPARRAILSAAGVGFASAKVQQSERTSPLSSVVSLLDELSAKITAQGAAEAKTYAAYKEWCEDTSTNKKFDIKTSKSQKEKLEAKISELSGNIESSESKIADLASSIATATTDLKSATAIRKKEESDFAKSEQELLEVVDTLGRASAILEREMQTSPAAFAQVSQGGWSNVLKTLSAVTDAASFSAADQQRLVALVQSKGEDSEGDDDLGAPAAAAYQSHSSNILDVLEDMKEKAEEQLASVRKAEVNAKHNFAMLKQSLDDQLKADNKDLAAEKSAKGAATEGKATAEGDLQETEADLKGSETELETATSTCGQVTTDHEATVKARNEELKVIAEAMAILKETTSGASSQTYSLLQANSGVNSGLRIRTHADLARSEVLTLVKRLAREHHSAALAQLASRIAAVVSSTSMAGAEPFAKVKTLISDLIARLESESSSEATEKAFCDEEMANTAAKKNELDMDASKLATKIDQATARSAELKEDVNQLQGDLAKMAKEQAEANKIRKDSNKDFVEAKADLEQGLNGVRKALVVLRDYYSAKESDAASFAQSAENQPEMPETFSASSGSGTNIIGILEVVESDFAKNLAEEETMEATAQEEYEKLTQQNKVSTATKEQDVKYKTKELTSLAKTIAELSSDLGTTNAELAAVMEYDGKIKGRCIAKPETYAERSQRRQAEIAGLKEALHILTEEVALLQHGSRGHARMRGSLKAHAL
eukprot:TRINITY_DN4510_c0_g1_i3.p1 TRINITY_DN4510_c0_g1~~TRINITY_DN4510_c0_g1_i3.p1  ORF type:complete len:716 (+),score=160.32 TRINITY_DN4510_c0_g1_i3:58-2205(+)